MTFLRWNFLKRKAAWAMVALAGILMFAGGAWATPTISAWGSPIRLTGTTGEATVTFTGEGGNFYWAIAATKPTTAAAYSANEVAVGTSPQVIPITGLTAGDAAKVWICTNITDNTTAENSTFATATDISATISKPSITAWAPVVRLTGTTGEAVVTFTGAGNFYWVVSASQPATAAAFTNPAVRATTSPQVIPITGLSAGAAGKVWICTDITDNASVIASLFATEAEISGTISKPAITAWVPVARLTTTSGTAKVTFTGDGNFYWVVSASQPATAAAFTNPAVRATTSPQVIPITGLSAGAAGKVWICTDITDNASVIASLFAAEAEIQGALSKPTIISWGNGVRVDETNGTAVVRFTGVGSFYWQVAETKPTATTGWSAAVVADASPQTINITGLTPSTAAKVWICTDITDAQTVEDNTHDSYASIAAEPPPAEATITQDGMIWSLKMEGNAWVKDAPVGEIVVIGSSATYDNGTTPLKIATPEIRITKDKVTKSWFYIKSITYTPQEADATNRAVTYFGSPASSVSDKGVRTMNRLGEDGTTILDHDIPRSLVAGKYDVVVEIGFKGGSGSGVPDIEIGATVGRSVTEVYEVLEKNLTSSMLTVELTAAEQVYSGTSKRPRVTVKDGSKFLQRDFETNEGYYDFAIFNQDEIDAAIDVGTYNVTVVGNGNYKGQVSKPYKIEKAELMFDPFVQYTFNKAYDGTTAVSVEDSTAFASDVVFAGYPSEAAELTAEDYIVKDGSLKYSKKDVGTGLQVVATIELSPTSDAAKNFKLKSNSFTYTGGVITKGAVTRELIKATFDSPARDFTLDGDNQILFNKSAKEVKVGWVAGVTNSGSKFTVYYDDLTTKPVAEGTYAVSVAVTAGANLEKADKIELGSLNIVSALRPIIRDGSPEDTSYYAKGSVTLRVNAVSPKDTLKTTGLSYQWYRVSDTGLVVEKGKTSATLVVNDTVVGTKQFQVKVTYKGAEQDTASAMSRTVIVTTYPEPVSLRGATIVANQTYEYDGTAKKLTESDLSVTVSGTSLDPTQFVIQSIRNNVNAGEGLVTIKGVGAYKESESGTFTITKKAVDISDLQIIYGTDYNGTAQEIRVGTVSGKSGLGEVTRVYDNDSARINAGTWNVELSIAEGQNFEAVESLPLTQPYVIRKVLIDESMLTYTGVPKEIAWNGQSQAIAKPTLKGVATFYTGDLNVVYTLNGEEVTTVTDSGLYTVRVAIAGDRNFSNYVIDLGTIEIHGKEWTGVKDAVREIPNKPAVEQVAIAPVKVVAGEVTVGPNPVANGSSLNIFWNGSKAVSGKLAVYTTLGKKVAVVPVSGSKKIGTWNTNGAPEGTYLIKGVLNTKDGTKVKVSNLVSVTR